MSSPESFPQAVKNSPRSHHKFVTFLYKLVSCLTGNMSFLDPYPSVAVIKAMADALAQANVKAKNGGPLAVAERNAKRIEADKLVDQLVTYVRVNVSAQAGDPASATAMILSAGLSVRKNNKVPKGELGTSLSQFYKVPFIAFDDKVIPPPDLMRDLKLEFLKRNLWLPIKREDNATIVLIDNPQDAMRRNNQSFLNTCIQFLLGT